MRLILSPFLGSKDLECMPNTILHMYDNDHSAFILSCLCSNMLSLATPRPQKRS